MTEPLYRTDPYLKEVDATVTALTPEGGIVLDRTIFYPTGGGQSGDAGRLTWQGGDIGIATTVKGEGDDIVLVLPITIDEAVLGAKVEVPTTTGRVTMSVPKGASGGRTLRLRGKGVKKRGGSGHGDQLVRLQIRLPETVDDELADFMEKWRASHAYDPRKTMGDRR